MKGLNRRSSFIRKRSALGALSIIGVTGALGAMGCLQRPLEPVEPRTTSTIVERLTQSSVDKIDLLLAIDNSRSMADKQAILALAVPDLVKRLVNPRCVDANGVAAQTQPALPTDACPDGTKREFEPVLDIHVGIISSSIGGHGADSCPDSDPNSIECSPNPNTTYNDKGHLLSRQDQCGGQNVPTYQSKGFLAWDPKGKLEPPGEIDIDTDTNGDMRALVPDLAAMVKGAGQIGCGYESQLESIYRFLVDPEPYDTIQVVNNQATPMGTDATLLAQRADFLRPDSLLAVVMLTDENDCSIREAGQYYYVGQLRVGQTAVRLPRARQECAVNPNDPCCKSCGQSLGNCPVDPTCTTNGLPDGPVALLSEAEDEINLRCFDQKRRFGIDFLYPVERYVTALTTATIANRAGDLVANPIFSDLNPMDTNTNIRDPGLVFLAGIVGVPWQDIARNKNDLTEGFKDAQEMAQPDPNNGLTAWQIILGDPANYVLPKDPLMIESLTERSSYGPNPVTGDPTVTSATPLGNSINGHEWTIPNDDLQYACIFPLLPGFESDCTDQSLAACDCGSPTNDNPLCAPNPNDANQPTLQVRAKAYPGIRELQVLQGIGSQGIVASVCPAQLNNPDSLDFGYRPAVGAIIDRLKDVLGGQCLPRTLTPNDEGQVPCLILEARNSQGNCVCDSSKARTEVSDDHKAAVKAAQEDPLAKAAGWDCFCEITQTLAKADLDACQNNIADPVVNENGDNVNGWCYVDEPAGVGNPDIVASCPENERRIIRFVGEGEAQPGATLFITCSGEAAGSGS